MIRAIVDGRKTQTRRIFRPENMEIRPHPKCGFYYETFRKQQGEMISTGGGPFIATAWNHYFPYGQPGDQLWVRETFKLCESTRADGHRAPLYRATSIVEDDIKWKPSIFMPRWASRMTLEITEVRVERVQEISEADAMAEGVASNGREADKGRQFQDYNRKSEFCSFISARSSFRSLWDSINAKRGFGWNVNPWVWAITFKKL